MSLHNIRTKLTCSCFKILTSGTTLPTELQEYEVSNGSQMDHMISFLFSFIK